MEPIFPLLKLPKNVIIQVLQSTDGNELFIISLISSKTKRLVTSLGIEAREIGISIYCKISVLVRTTKFRLTLDVYDASSYLPVDITLPVAAYFEYQKPIKPSTPFNFSDWLNHIQTVFCWTKPTNVYFCQGCERFEVKYLNEAIGNVNTLFLTGLVTANASRKILKHFNSPRELVLFQNPFGEVCQIQQIFIQNFDIIDFDAVYSLDDMLLVNSEKIDFTRPTTQKQFNKFLKHWIRGSNPRLQFLSLIIDATETVDGEIYLKGIKCIGMREDAKREIRRKHSLSVNVDMIQIRRKDGTAAVIATEKSENIHFIVLD
ncbi:hypothetical protein GCK72_008653 [Caenorhabditis remanei]|uniref:F-box domain-containing protein n=1 Tax=Caenorhabditis remanei TaxID=31234 RepID=A0A6A5H0V5_CAERE|nr:hypothetical protein GCK72_008653 [Caenorhabditis remanei]KAF1760404.1 hypothetical protein GCK72_008653 [Caenorhabditis remanei]